MMHEIDMGKRTLHSTAVAAGTIDVTPTALSMAGFDSIAFEVVMGTITSGAVTSILVQQSDDAAGSPDSFDTIQSITVADDGDDKLYLTDTVRPSKAYVRCVIDRGTENAVVNSIVAIQYGARTLPVTHAASVANTSKGVTPDES